MEVMNVRGNMRKGRKEGKSQEKIDSSMIAAIQGKVDKEEK